MNEKKNPDRDEVFKKKWRELNDMSKVTRESQQLIIDYIKDYMRPIEDKSFLVINDGEEGCYVTLDHINGKDIFFSLLDSNKPYDNGFLLEALLKELVRLWKLERNSVIK